MFVYDVRVFILKLMFDGAFEGELSINNSRYADYWMSDDGREEGEERGEGREEMRVLRERKSTFENEY